MSIPQAARDALSAFVRGPVGDGRKASHCDGGEIQRSLQRFMVLSPVKSV